MRKIIHIDMDCFFVAVEVRDRPELLGKPVAVGGLPEERGVISTASYEARAYGVHSALSSAEALRRCPKLILIRSNFSKYKEASQAIYQIFSQYSDIVEAISIDEAFLDVSLPKMPFKTATLAAKAIREHIFRETKLTASAGIAPNPFLAKVASDWHKPNGQFTITYEMVDEFILKLPLCKVPGVGRVTEEKLKKMGFLTCGDLQALSLGQIKGHFGKWGQRLYNLCRGIDERVLGLKKAQKSISVEHTYAHDLLSLDECNNALPALFKELTARCEKAQIFIKSIFVKIKFADFQLTTVDDSSLNRLDLLSFQKILAKAQARRNKPIRLIGIGVRIQEEHIKPYQLELF